jgi:hypothetical protein
VAIQLAASQGDLNFIVNFTLPSRIYIGRRIYVAATEIDVRVKLWKYEEMHKEWKRFEALSMAD